jgi:hypothetical protein
MLKRVGLIIALLALLSLSGCIDQKLSIEERLLCMDLSAQSFAFVPKCSSVEDCFSKVEQSFFDFEEGVFNPRIQSRLYYYKNEVALSWFYFSSARENLKQIFSACATNSPALLAKKPERIEPQFVKGV